MKRIPDMELQNARSTANPGPERNAGEMPSLPRWVGSSFPEQRPEGRKVLAAEACQATHSEHNFGVWGSKR